MAGACTVHYIGAKPGGWHAICTTWPLWMGGLMERRLIGGIRVRARRAFLGLRLDKRRGRPAFADRPDRESFTS
jgi:hypothetical protein